MRVGLVGPSQRQRSLPLNSERTVNLFPVFDQQGQEVAALYGTPGLSLFATAGDGPNRNSFRAANGRAFTVSGAGLYEVNEDGTTTLRGTLDQSQGNVSIDENGLQLGICDGTSVYIFTYATNAFLKVTDADLPTSGTLTFIDGYFVVNQANTGKFFISALYDGLTWTALDFATAESSPDNLIRVLNAVGQLWLLGEFTTEIWTNTGDSAFPFQRIAGAKMEVGILAPHTAVAIDNSMFWVGRDRIGSGIVYRAKGFTPQRISTESVELAIQAATSPSTIKGFTYEEDGHVFYMITGGGMETSWVYDISTQLWHERAYLNAFGVFEQHLASSYMFAFDKRLVGDRLTGNIYQMSLDYYSDNGSALVRERIFTHLGEESIRQKYNSLQILMESGVGLQSGQGSDPQILLKVSKDGGRTWSDWFSKSFGAVGKYAQNVVFRRLGIAQQMTFRVRVSDPVKVILIGAYLK